MKTGFKAVMTLTILAMVGMMMGCATTQTEKAPSGFLGEYPPFEAGPEGVDQRYMKEGVDFRNYNKIMMDEVVFFFKSDAEYKGIQPSEISELSEAFHKTFTETLGSFLTDVPGPDVIRMRLAVTDLEPSSPVGGTMSTIVPIGLAYSLAKKGATGEYAGIGSASMEVEFLDSTTNERLAAAVDKAPGGKLDVGKLSGAKSAFEFWAKRIRAFMDDMHLAK